MPRKFSPNQKRMWLELYEEGKSEASIATKYHCSVRTVKKGIQEAKLERDARAARSELIKDALRKHQNTLLTLLQDLSSVLKTPDIHQFVPWEPAHGPKNFSVEGVTVECDMSVPRVTSATLDLERRIEWGLLREHLGKDRFWQLLLQWKRLYSAYLEAIIVGKRKLASLLKEDTKEEVVYALLDKKDKDTFIYKDFVNEGLQRLIEPRYRLANVKELEENIIEDTEKGKINLGSLTIAEAPDATSKYRQHIVATLNEMRKSVEARQIIGSYEKLEDITKQVGRAAEELVLLNLVPGQCRVCSRLGV